MTSFRVLKNLSPWEAPFWLAFLYWSLAPSRMALHVDLSEVSIDCRDICLLVLALVYICPVTYRWLHSRKRLSEPGRLFRATALLTLYAAVSLSWSPIEPLDAKAMFLTLVLFAVSVAASHGLVCLLRPDQLRDFLRRTAVALSLVCAVYSADSFFLLGLRTPELVRQEWDFGVPRVAGPLFASSTGYFLIVPALAYLLQDLISNRGHRVVSIVCITMLGVTLFALGSRGGMLVILCFLALCVAFVRDISKKVLACALTTVVLLLAAVLVLQRGEIERIGSFEDQARDSFHRDAWNRVRTRGIVENLFGPGYGSIWPWYRLDEYVALKMFDMSVGTRDGWIMAGRYQYHPHSVLLLLGIELGLAGLFYFAYLCRGFCRMMGRQRLSNDQAIWACGLLASALSLLLDLFLFYRPRMAVVWWVWVFAALRSSEYAHARAQFARTVQVYWTEVLGEGRTVTQ